MGGLWDLGLLPALPGTASWPSALTQQSGLQV